MLYEDHLKFNLFCLLLEVHLHFFFFPFLFSRFFDCLFFFSPNVITANDCYNQRVFALFLYSASYWIVSTYFSKLAHPRLLSFLVTKSLSISFLGCKHVCILFNFIVLWSVCLFAWILLLFIPRRFNDILQKWLSWYLYFDYISAAEFILEKVFIFLRYFWVSFCFSVLFAG